MPSNSYCVYLLKVLRQNSNGSVDSTEITINEMESSIGVRLGNFALTTDYAVLRCDLLHEVKGKKYEWEL
jgi:hypothetical protein